MRQFDVYPTPSAAQRRERPFVLVLQHDRLAFTRTVVVAPLSRLPFVTAQGRLVPRLRIGSESFGLITNELAAIDRRRLKEPPIDNLEAERIAIQNALDHIFSAAG